MYCVLLRKTDAVRAFGGVARETWRQLGDVHEVWAIAISLLLAEQIPNDIAAVTQFLLSSLVMPYMLHRNAANK